MGILDIGVCSSFGCRSVYINTQLIIHTYHILTNNNTRTNYYYIIHSYNVIHSHYIIHTISNYNNYLVFDYTAGFH